MLQDRFVVGSDQPNADSATPSASIASEPVEAVATGSPEGSEKPAGPPSEPGVLDDSSAFVARLAGAMQSIVSLERVRIANYTEERRRSHVEAIRERDAAGADQLRTIAANETTAIEQWIEAEMKRIQQEGERRKRTVQDDLHSSLAAHRSTFDGALEGAEKAIAAYRSEVEEFFARLDGVDDPVVIAEHAVKRPAFPALPEVPRPVAFLGARVLPADSHAGGQNGGATGGYAPDVAAQGNEAGADDPGADVSEATDVATPGAVAAAADRAEAVDETAGIDAARAAETEDFEHPEAREDLPASSERSIDPVDRQAAGGPPAAQHPGEPQPTLGLSGSAGATGLLQRTVAALRPVTLGHARERDAEPVPVMSDATDEGECEHCSSSRARGAAFCVACGRPLKQPATSATE